MLLSQERKKNKFKSIKLQCKIISNRKIMKNKSKELNKLKFSNNLYITESMCAGNHGLFFKYRKLKKAKKISTHGSSTMLLLFNLIRIGKFKKFSKLKIFLCC